MSTSTTIRVSFETRNRLAALADEAHQPMTAALEEALDALERRRFFDSVNERYAELRADPEAWRVIEAERALEANALGDGLD